MYGEAMHKLSKAMDCDIICQRGIPACIMARHRKTDTDAVREILPIFYSASSCESQEYHPAPDLALLVELIAAMKI